MLCGCALLQTGCKNYHFFDILLFILHIGTSQVLTDTGIKNRPFFRKYMYFTIQCYLILLVALLDHFFDILLFILHIGTSQVLTDTGI